ncbi:hypothetical protein JCM13664_00460 [Methylothermus subterraneus]
MLKSNAFYFKPKWTLTFLTALAILAFLSLARWQWHRAEEKQALLRLYAKEREAPTLYLGGEERLENEAGRLRYRSVTVTGVWDGGHSLLLDNRTWRGTVGYEVLTPLEIEGGLQVVLVNRGWVAAGSDRTRLPEVTLPRKRATIHGMVDRFPSPGMYLQGMEIPTEGWPAVVQRIDPKVISQRLGREVLDFQIKLAPDQEDGYVREWRLDFIDPHRNRGYALQWASFALIALGLWIRHGFKRGRELQMKQRTHG